MNVQIRKGTPEDIPSIYALIHELAILERAEHELINTPEQLLADGFGERPAFEFLVVELGEEVVGMALYFYHYSTWKGKFLYLEDLIITQAQRGKGYGKALLEALHEEALAHAANRIGWQVLDWNQPAIDFYRAMGAEIDAEWLNCRLWVKAKKT
ncbi:MAG: GNAT family N-acetyltransferase [Bernardetiaceae bacterium]